MYISYIFIIIYYSTITEPTVLQQQITALMLDAVPPRMDSIYLIV